MPIVFDHFRRICTCQLVLMAWRPSWERNADKMSAPLDLSNSDQSLNCEFSRVTIAKSFLESIVRACASRQVISAASCALLRACCEKDRATDSFMKDEDKIESFECQSGNVGSSFVLHEVPIDGSESIRNEVTSICDDKYGPVRVTESGMENTADFMYPFEFDVEAAIHDIFEVDEH